MNRHRGATTDVFPPDVRDSERNRSFWVFEDLGKNRRCPDAGLSIGVGAHGVTADLPPRMRIATREQIAVPKPLQECCLCCRHSAGLYVFQDERFRRSDPDAGSEYSNRTG